MVAIKSVLPSSPAAGVILPGDELISLNAHPIRDVLDYGFYSTDPSLCVTLRRGDAELEVQIEKGEYDELGLIFDSFLMDRHKSCRNKCIFCFIDQNPPGMRESIYFKDDDERLSFLHGNYITLTNLDDADVRRIIDMHISPVNVSVHTTDPALRCRMLSNRFAGDALRYLRELCDGGIAINAQIVLCRGINDGEALERTLGDLEALYPALRSVSVVPAGLTSHRDGLYPLEPFTPEQCRDIVKSIERRGDACKARFGSRLFYASDEFYLAANSEKLPPYKFYEDFPQLENGVGMIALFERDMRAELRNITKKASHNRCHPTLIVTGAAAYATISRAVYTIRDVCYNYCDIEVRAVRNDFYGPSVTVAGLICGRDIAAQLGSDAAGRRVLIPSNMLRSEGDLFLDGMSVDELAQQLGTNVVTVKPDGRSFVRAILS